MWSNQEGGNAVLKELGALPHKHPDHLDDPFLDLEIERIST
jgi:hypothetical protein